MAVREGMIEGTLSLRRAAVAWRDSGGGKLVGVFPFFTYFFLRCHIAEADPLLGINGTQGCKCCYHSCESGETLSKCSRKRSSRA